MPKHTNSGAADLPQQHSPTKNIYGLPPAGATPAAPKPIKKKNRKMVLRDCLSCQKTFSAFQKNGAYCCSAKCRKEMQGKRRMKHERKPMSVVAADEYMKLVRLLEVSPRYMHAEIREKMRAVYCSDEPSFMVCK
jgi:hypothetical protein